MTKKKIAILTQPLGHNYGGIIQNYALQKVLKQLGYQPETINRVGNRHTSKVRSILSKAKQFIYKHLLGKNILTKKDREQISNNNVKFLNKYINRSLLINADKDLAEYFKNKKFNAVIVGSDQTWRPKYSPNIYNYYLDFLKDNNQIKKLAYASSFGTAEWEYTEEQTKIVKQLVKQFHAISVREAAGVDLCREKLRVEAVHLLDPTLLLTAEDYSELINQPKANKELFTYVLDESKEKQDFIQFIGKELKLKQHTNQAQKFDAKVKKTLEELIMPPLEGWLQGFRDAEFVITDSFHGTVFSIINKKTFISIVNKERGASRFESFLTSLDLEDRLVYEVNNFDVSLLENTIDYEAVHQKLKVLKDESLNFLKENL